MYRLSSGSSHGYLKSPVEVPAQPVNLFPERQLLLCFDDLKTLHSCSLGPAGGCHRYDDVIDPSLEQDRISCVRLTCTSEGCHVVRWMHGDCFERWESHVFAYLRFQERSGSFGEKDRSQGALLSKGHDLVRNVCRCPCGLGYIRRDVLGSRLQNLWQVRSRTPAPLNISRSTLWQPGEVKQVDASNYWLPINEAKRLHSSQEVESFRLRSASVSSNESNTTTGSSSSSSTSSSPLVGFSGELIQHLDHLFVASSSDPLHHWATQQSAATDSGNKNSIASAASSYHQSMRRIPSSGTQCNTDVSRAVDFAVTAVTSQGERGGRCTEAFTGASFVPPTNVNLYSTNGRAPSIQCNPVVLSTTGLQTIVPVIFATSGSGLTSSQKTSSTKAPFNFSALSLNSDSSTENDSVPATKLSPGNIFKHRSDFSVFNRLSLGRRNPYNIKLEDEGPYGNDEIRSMLMKTLSARRLSSIQCATCPTFLDIYDQFPLIDGTFFVSPRLYNCDVTVRQTRVSGSDVITSRRGVAAQSKAVARQPAYLTAVCLSCMNGRNARLRCRWCHVAWDGSSLVVGSMYSYDVFAAQACCRKRLSCSGCGEDTRGRSATTASVENLHFSDYSRLLDCQNCGQKDFHAVKAVSEIYEL